MISPNPEQPDKPEKPEPPIPAHPNLKPFVKGDPRINRKGRPKGTGITDRLRKIVEIDNDGAAADALAKLCVSRAASGDFKFFKELIDRLDGKVADQVESSNEITFRVVYGQPEDNPPSLPE